MKINIFALKDIILLCKKYYIINYFSINYNKVKKKFAF